MSFTIEHLSERIQTRTLSPVRLVQECLHNIEKHQQLNAFITVLDREALENARAVEAEIANGSYRGPLHGIPIAIKDFYDTAGIKTTAGFQHFSKRVPKKDAAMVTKLKDAGAIIMGKTNMHKLGMGTTSIDSYFGAVCNPWDTNFIAGGSSGGSAVAVATGMCLAAIDTDVVGSCRIPAACCGVVGFKPAYGQLDNTGILEGEPVDDIILKLSHVGITARSVPDIRIIYSTLASTAKPLGSSAKEHRIGIVTNFEASTEIKRLFDFFVNEINAKMDLSQMTLPFESARFSLDTLDQDRADGTTALFKDRKLCILPTLTEKVLQLNDAKKLGDQAVSPANSFFANYYGLPAISIPVSKDSNGLPFSIQLISEPSSVGLLFETANQIEEWIQWNHFYESKLN